MTKSHALAAVLNIIKVGRKILGFQIIMLVIGFLILFFKRRYTRSDGGVFVLIIWFRLDVLCAEKVEDGAADEDVSFPLLCISEPSLESHRKKTCNYNKSVTEHCWQGTEKPGYLNQVTQRHACNYPC